MYLPGHLICALRRSGLVLIALAIAGCASTSNISGATFPTRTALTTFSLEGRFSLHQQNKNASGDSANCSTIVNGFVSDGVDLIMRTPPAR